MDDYLQQLWREFAADPTTENYERVALAHSRVREPLVIVIPARILVSLENDRSEYRCNLTDPTQEPADYFDNTMEETTIRIFSRAQQFGVIGGRKGIPPSNMSMPTMTKMVEHKTWRCFIEIFKPEALEAYVNSSVGIIFLIDPMSNIVAWHTRMAQPFYPSSSNVVENIFINCDDETKAMFRNALTRGGSYEPSFREVHNEAWGRLKRLFIDIFTA